MSRLRRMILTLVLGLPLAMTLTIAVRADEKRVMQIDGYAIGGYDAVAYFREGKPVKGSPDHALMWRGATWLFATADAMSAFEMNPKAYAPQFGGYCAYAIAEGDVLTADPTIFAVEGGRLYLNHDFAAHSAWISDFQGNRSRAEANWPDILQR